jgi:hypothetical protein
MFLENTTYGWYEGAVVAIDLATGNVVADASFLWNYFTTSNPFPIIENGSCIGSFNGQYSFLDEQKQMLYTINSRNVAEFNISSGRPVFVQKRVVELVNAIQGWAFSAKNRRAYAVNGNDLYAFNIDDDWNFEIMDSDFPALYASSLATIDASNANYVALRFSGGYDYVNFTIYVLKL